MFRSALVLAVVAFSSTAWASKPAVVDAYEPFAEQRQRVESALNGGSTYREISAEDRAKVLQALGRMGSKLDSQKLADLNEPDKLEVFNNQEIVNTLLTKAADDSRMICQRERVVGSKLPQNVCMSVAERREARENGVNILREQRPSQSVEK